MGPSDIVFIGGHSSPNGNLGLSDTLQILSQKFRIYPAERGDNKKTLNFGGGGVSKNLKFGRGGVSRFWN